MEDKILNAIIIGLAIAVLVAIVVLIANSQQTITGFHNPVVNTTYSQFLYNIHTLTPIQSISVNFSMTPAPNSTPANGIQIILGSNNVKFNGGVGSCGTSGICGLNNTTGGVYQCNTQICTGTGPIKFSGIIAGFDVYGPQYFYICSSDGQCYATPISPFVQPISGTLTLNVSSNKAQVTLKLSNGQVYTLTAPFGIKTNIAEVSVTSGGYYAIWNLNSITIKTSII